MLSKIFIRNFALIDSLEISLSEGLQVITGETGAGKSIILGALRLMMGERADIRSMSEIEEKSIVEAEFSISDNLQPFFQENDLDFEPQTIIRRELLPSGKSRAFVNDIPVTLDILKQLSGKLVDIHSQFETSDLFKEEYQFRIIDGLSENRLLTNGYQKDFSEAKLLERRLAEMKSQLERSNKESDYQSFILSELQDANLDETDLEDLQQKISTQENAEAISENLAQIFARFDAEEIGILDAMLDSKNRLSKVAGLSHEFSELLTRFDENFVELKDILFELQNKAEQIDINQELYEELSGRINKINLLFLKHNVNTIPELIGIRDELNTEQSNFADLENSIITTEKMLSNLYQRMSQQTAVLTKNRQVAADIFQEKMEALLSKLGLEKARIRVQLSPADSFNFFGKDKIEILFQANSGFPLKNIQHAVSGGERSRVMLAIKKIMAENSELPTLILDEIDTGVSGKIAEETGNVMREMAGDMQLVVITHLAQVAAKGDAHYKVIKTEVAGKTQTQIIHLDQNQKLQEIAQLLSGSRITQAALQQAAELMK